MASLPSKISVGMCGRIEAVFLRTALYSLHMSSLSFRLLRLSCHPPLSKNLIARFRGFRDVSSSLSVDSSRCLRQALLACWYLLQAVFSSSNPDLLLATIVDIGTAAFTAVSIASIIASAYFQLPLFYRELLVGRVEPDLVGPERVSCPVSSMPAAVAGALLSSHVVVPLFSMSFMPCSRIEGTSSCPDGIVQDCSYRGWWALKSPTMTCFMSRYVGRLRFC